MKLSVFVGFALCAPASAIRKGARKHAVANVDCEALADLEVGGLKFGETLKLVCQSWPARLGEFPVTDIETAKGLFGKVMDEGGVWDQIKQIREEKQDRGFCWRNNTLAKVGEKECPLGYHTAGLTGSFGGLCTTGCMWSTHPISCGLGCGTDRGECTSAVLQQVFRVAEGVSIVQSFVYGDDKIRKTVFAITELAEFMLETLPPIVDAVQGAIDIINGGHGAMVAVILFQYLQETAGDVRVPAEKIRDAIQRFGAILAELADEKVREGDISPLTIIRQILDGGEEMLEWGVLATKVFSHPTCSITDNVAFTIETAADDRLLGPWIQRGEIEGHPRYSLLGDRRTNLEWSNANGISRWVMFSDSWTGYIGRRFLYDSSVRSIDYPLSGWRILPDGKEPVPEFVPVKERVEE